MKLKQKLKSEVLVFPITPAFLTLEELGSTIITSMDKYKKTGH